jgi:transcriptional regulator of arginine metabolism
MKNRFKRQAEIRKVIQKGNVHSQDELLVELKGMGFDLTQATLSRDLKEMRVAKMPHQAKGYVYVMPEADKIVNTPSQSRINYLADGFRDLRFSGNLAVLRTQPGYASAIAAVIDKAEPWEIIGTVAGDDTILMIMKEGISKLDLINALVLIMPKLEGKI